MLTCSGAKPAHLPASVAETIARHGVDVVKTEILPGGDYQATLSHGGRQHPLILIAPPGAVENNWVIVGGFAPGFPEDVWDQINDDLIALARA